MIPILFKNEDYLIKVLEDGNTNIIEDGNSKMIWLGSVPIGYESHGLGELTDTISCEVEEERNGSYELTMEYPITGVHFGKIEMRSIIVAKPNYLDEPQPFRVYQITKPLNGKCTIYARHISYDLSDIPVQPFTAAGIQSALNGLKANAMYDVSDWTFATSRATASPFKVDVPSSIRSWFGGKEGSLLDVYGGEWHYTGKTCRLENSRGADRGVTIRYGVNLTELKQEENCNSCYTGVLGYWSDQDGNVVQGTVQNVSGTFDYVRIFILDCSEDYEDAPTAAQLNAKAAAYIANNNVGVPQVNLTLNFVMLQGLLNRVDLCDTVRVVFEKLGVEATAKCIRVRWNVLLDRYEEAEFGDAKSTITDSIIEANNAAAQNAKSLRETATVLQIAIDNAVQKISGNLGGYVILHDTNDDGYPDELLIMDTDDITTATNVWRWNQQGLMHANSYTGTYANAAITMDGQIVADAITTGTLRGIELISTDETNTVDIVNGKITTTRTGAGKTETTNYNYRIYDANDTLMANLTISAERSDGYRSGILTIDDTNGYENVYLGAGFLRLRRPNDGGIGADLQAATTGGVLNLYYPQGGQSLYAQNGMLVLKNEYYSQGIRSVVDGLRIDNNGGYGENIRLYWANGANKIYLGTVSQTGLLDNTPCVAFCNENGTIKTYYALNRAYITDESNADSSKWERGYVVHGHDAGHTYTFGLATTGSGSTTQYYLWSYIDGESMGYIPITASSDERFKSGIEPISEAYKRAVGKVELDTFFYDFTTPIKSMLNTERRFGIIAQDLIAALESEGISPTESELITTAPDPDGERYLVNYTPFLVARLAAAEDRIKSLEDRLAALEARLEAE